MQYYDPNDRKPRLWAVVVTLLYAVLIGVSFAFVSFDFRRIEEKVGDEIEIELYDPPVRETPPPTPVKPTPEPRVHQQTAPTEQNAQVGGKDETTRTPNPKALFKMNKGGDDEPENAGNPFAKQGEDKASGTGPGLKPDGFDQLDKGLQGRGLKESLQKPYYPGSKSGKVLVRVTVNSQGLVTSATFEPVGSTTSDSQLVEAAIAAARKARFTESNAAVAGGTITYVFNITKD